MLNTGDQIRIKKLLKYMWYSSDITTQTKNVKTHNRTT